MDDIVLAIVGPLSKELNPKIQSELAGADILILPAGGKPFISQASAAKLVRQIEPSAVIPSLFTDLKPFLKEIGATGTKPEDKFTVKKKDLMPKAMTVQVLSF